MKIDIPKYNYTKEQLDELEEIIIQFQYEFDTPENRKLIEEIISMKVDIPKYNYTEEQLQELEEILYQYQYEFDTPENRKKLEHIISKKVDEFVKSNREKKINQVISDGSSEVQ